MNVQSDLVIHPTADIFGEPDALLSMTALRAAAEGLAKQSLTKAIRSPMLPAKR